MTTDTYKTILTPSQEVLYKEKNSKFFGYVFPVAIDEDIKTHLENLRRQHFGAGHFCYAYQIGTDQISFRANDDGEPSNSAGMPIYGQIQSFGLTNVLVVVVRFFGGTKLGVGGLISAYRTTAQMALENSVMVEKTIDVHFRLVFDYKNINKIMGIIKERRIDIISQKMEMRCEIEISTRRKFEDATLQLFDGIFEVEIEKIA